MGGGGAGLAGLVQGASHLTGDLPLADDGGLQPGYHGEEVAGHALTLVRVHGLEHEARVQPAAFGDPLGNVLLGPVHETGGLARDLAVELQPVAGGQRHGARQRSCGDGVLGHTEGSGAQPGNSVEVNGSVGCDKTEENHNQAILDEVDALRPA